MANRIFSITLLFFMCQIFSTLAQSSVGLRDQTGIVPDQRNALRCLRRIYEVYNLGKSVWINSFAGIKGYWKAMGIAEEICNNWKPTNEEDVKKCLRRASKLSFSDFKESFQVYEGLKWKFVGAIYSVVESCIF